MPAGPRGLPIDDTLRARTPAGFAFVGPDGRFRHVDAAFAALTGVAAGAHAARHVLDIVPEPWRALRPELERALRGEAVGVCEVREESAAETGTRTWTIGFHPLSDADGPLGVALVASDSTAQRRFEDALRVRTDLYAMLARTNRAVSRCRSADELFDEICRVAVETGGFRFAWIGVPRDGRVVAVASAGTGQEYLDSIVITLDPDDPRSRGPTGTVFRTAEQVVVDDFMAAAETQPWHASAARAGFASAAAFPFEQRGSVVAVLHVYADTRGFFTDELVETLGELAPSVSFALDSLAAERDRRRDEADLRLRDRAMQAIAQGITIVDARAPDQPIIYASTSFEALTGYAVPEILGRNCRFLQGPQTDPHAVALLRDAIAEGRDCSVELLNYRKDGTTFWNALAISPVRDDDGMVTHFVGVQTDVTERHRLEAQLRQSQRLEALGQLAGGVAHDFNNLLTVIMGNALLALGDETADATAALEDIVAAGDRATELIRQLLAFSRQQPVDPTPVDVNLVVNQARRMLDRLIETSIEREYDLTPEPIVVLVDRSQLEQVLVNLALNARDAMPGGGRLAIRTAVDPERRVATLTIADTGPGIEPEHLELIFTPFFTTKEVGEGTGLGLAAAYGIVEGAGGRIGVQSEPGAGAIFTVELPLADVRQAATGAQAASDGQGGRLDRLTALLVEDDGSVRAVTRELLLAAGCAEVVACDPHEAVGIVEDGRRIDVLVTDLVMPDIGGLELASAVRVARPDLPVLFVSGYPRERFEEILALERSAYLAKPFASRDLAIALGALVGESASDDGP